MDDHARLRAALDDVAGGGLVPYLGPSVSALGQGGGPTEPQGLCALIEAEVRAPKRARGNLWAVAQYVESRRFRATLEALVRRAFANPAGPNPLHQWLAGLGCPMIVDAWYDGNLIAAMREGPGNWGWVQGVSRNGEWSEIWHRAYDAGGALRPEGADRHWQTLVYKPHGLAAPGQSFLISDSDYVEVLTEIDIQTPIPDEVQARRANRGFLFLGCRFDDQTLRTFARQIAKRSGGGHVAVIDGDLTRMERLFMAELDITRLNLPLSAVVAELPAGVPA
ncbi:SIR2 family protein [Paracoccaceae bacterium Fryx2]|nr:SIR2 family protein [Paracoccaceae bacterium Fryx2]